MSATTKPTRKKFRVAVSGATVDGRDIKPEHLRQAAANYDQASMQPASMLSIIYHLSLLVNSALWVTLPR